MNVIEKSTHSSFGGGVNAVCLLFLTLSIIEKITTFSSSSYSSRSFTVSPTLLYNSTLSSSFNNSSLACNEALDLNVSIFSSTSIGPSVAYPSPVALTVAASVISTSQLGLVGPSTSTSDSSGGSNGGGAVSNLSSIVLGTSSALKYSTGISTSLPPSNGTVVTCCHATQVLFILFFRAAFRG